MKGADVEAILQRIEDAIGRIDIALGDVVNGSQDGGSQEGTGDSADEARLREAVVGAIARIDLLLARAGAAPDEPGANAA